MSIFLFTRLFTYRLGSSHSLTMGKFHQLGHSAFYPLASYYYTLFILLPSAAYGVCYYPNGESVSDPAYQPCVSYAGSTSMCCATNRTNPSGGNLANGNTVDICLENGLCEDDYSYTDDNGTTIKVTQYYRDFCTSTDWTTNDACLNVCTAETVRSRQ